MCTVFDARRYSALLCGLTAARGLGCWRALTAVAFAFWFRFCVLRSRLLESFLKMRNSGKCARIVLKLSRSRSGAAAAGRA